MDLRSLSLENPALYSQLSPHELPSTNYVPDVLHNSVKGKPPPPGYEVRKYRHHWPISLIGAGAFGTVYGASIAVSTNFPGGEYYVIPVVGPVLVLKEFIEEEGAPGLGLIGYFVLGATTIGVAFIEAAALAMIPAGLIPYREKWVRKYPTDISLAPLDIEHADGFAVRLRF